jgi:hypothetical protein
VSQQEKYMASLKEHFESVLRMAKWLSEEENSVNALWHSLALVEREFADHNSDNSVYWKVDGGADGLMSAIGGWD